MTASGCGVSFGGDEGLGPRHSRWLENIGNVPDAAELFLENGWLFLLRCMNFTSIKRKDGCEAEIK